jgi:peptide/nickel transport system substrate-binding protein
VTLAGHSGPNFLPDRGPPDADKRNQMYVDLQEQIQQKAPFVIMFQAVQQVGMQPKVSGFVNGATSDSVYCRLVEKN